MSPFSLLLTIGVGACQPAGERVEHLFQSPDAWIDLTHPFNAETIYWPTADPLQLETVSAGLTDG